MTKVYDLKSYLIPSAVTDCKIKIKHYLVSIWSLSSSYWTSKIDAGYVKTLLMGEKSILGVGNRGRHSDTILAGSLYVLMMVHSWNEIRYKYRKIMRIILLHNIRLRANGRNIVNQQLPGLLDVTSCVRLHTLLHVVECCCVLLRKISFVPWSPKESNNVGSVCTALPTLLEPRTLITHGLQRLMGCIIPRCTAGTNIVGSCCIRVQTTANTHATCVRLHAAKCYKINSFEIQTPFCAGCDGREE